MTRQQPSRKGVNPQRDSRLTTSTNSSTDSSTASSTGSSTDSNTAAVEGPPHTWGPRLFAGLLTTLQAVLVAGFALWFAVETAQGQSEDTARGVTAALLIAIFAVGLSIIARAWLTGAAWPRTPTILWNALLIPVAMTLWQSDRQAASSGLLLLVLGTIAAAILSGAEDRDPS